MVDTQRIFYRDVIEHGLQDLRELNTVYPLGIAIPPEKLSKWLEEMNAPPRLLRPPKTWSFLNHFKIGADPEFVLQDPVKLNPVPGTNLGLKTGRAYGADQNGRLIEIRPAPSRSAMRVLASVMSTIRWMAIMVPQTRDYNWIAGAYQFDDGLGGHVHFGRKSPKEGTDRRASLADEVKALDKLTSYLISLGVYPKAECERRTRGDARGQIYGKMGDIREQAHGYEYRTFPSWLDNPWLAFFSLTMAKLAVADPALFKKFPTDKKMDFRLKQVLAYFKDEDDDAAIAYLALLRAGMPRHYGGDFKGRWGANYPKNVKTDTEVVPLSIEPSDDEVSELFNHLVHGEPLVEGVPAPSWDFPKPPAGYYMVLDTIVTDRLRGMGELLWDICAPLELKKSLGLKHYDGHETLRVSGDLANRFPADWKERVAKIKGTKVAIVGNSGGDCVWVSNRWRDGAHLKRTRELLTCGILPFFKVSEANKLAYDLYKQHGTGAPPMEKTISQVLVCDAPHHRYF